MSERIDTTPRKRWLPEGLWPLWAAGFISTAGDSMHQVALMWLIYELTGSKTATGLIGMSQYLPAIIISVFAGALVDRMDRRRVMIVADAGRALLVVLIPTLYLWHALSGVLLGMIAFTIALFTTVFVPARDSIVPQLVTENKLTQAGSALQAGYGMAYFAGPVLAAALLPWAKIEGLFYADSLTYVASLGFLLLLRLRPRAIVTEAMSPWGLMKDGIAYAKSHGYIRGLLLVTAVDNLFIMGPALVGAPLYVRLHLGLGAGAYAATEGAFALGMMVGSVLVHRWGNRLPRGKTLLWALMWDGISFVPFMFIDTLTPALIMWFVHSIGIPFIIVPRMTLVQTRVPEHYQGRIFSMVNLTVVGLSAISCSLTGIAAEFIAINELFAVIGVSATIVGASGWLSKDLRRAA